MASPWNGKVLNLTWPIIVSNLSIPLAGMVDTAVVGHLPNPAYIGAVALGALVFSTLYWVVGFLRMGTTGFVAQSYGAKDADEFAAVCLRSFGTAVVIGALVIMLQYPIHILVFWFFEATQEVEDNALLYFSIRIWGVVFGLSNLVVLGILFGAQRMRAALCLQLLLNGLNVVLDLVFVVGFGWGVGGVAFATLISEAVTCVVGVWYCTRIINRPLHQLIQLPILRRDKLLGLAYANINIFIRTCCIEAVLLNFMWISSKSGEIILAANAVLLHLFTFLAFGLDGFAHAVEALAGSAYGAKDRATMRKSVLYTLLWCFITALLISIIYAVAGNFFVGLITGIPEVRAAAAEYLIWIILAPIICTLAFLFDGVYIGTTRTAEMRNTMLVSIAVYMPFAYFGYTNFGNHGLWFAIMVFMVARGVLLAWLYPKIEAHTQTI